MGLYIMFSKTEIFASLIFSLYVNDIQVQSSTCLQIHKCLTGTIKHSTDFFLLYQSYVVITNFHHIFTDQDLTEPE